MIRKTGLALIALLFVTGCKDNSIFQAAMDNCKKVYDSYCLGCHMEDAMGVPSLNPPLAGSDVLLNDKLKSIRIVLRGSDELKDQPNRNYKNIMAPLASLTDQEIADVLTFARNSFGNKASAISVKDVKTEKTRLK